MQRPSPEAEKITFNHACTSQIVGIKEVISIPNTPIRMPGQIA